MKLAVALLLAATATAHADDKELDRATVIFARGDKLYKTDGKGRNEVELVTLPTKTTVRALRTDAHGSVLLADIAGKWWWMPLDGSKQALAPLPCGEGPAQLPPDGSCVICRSAAAGDKSLVINFGTGKQIPVDVPALGARIINVGLTRRVVYTDKAGVWSIALADQRKKTQLAPEAPLRSFLASPDGSKAVGVYNDHIFENKTQVPVEALVTVQLDGQGVKRKGIRNGVPLEWSHDGEYVLVQEGSAACLMRAGGGQYKCWKGFTAVSIAPDGSYALVLGNRDGSKTQSKQAPKSKQPAKPKPAPTDDEPGGDSSVNDDVPVSLPSGPLALYRAKLDGPYDGNPVLVTKIVDGAAVWVPGK